MIKHISYSHLHLLACPYAAFLRYKAAIKGPTTEHLALGNALHLALELSHKTEGKKFDKQIAVSEFLREYNKIIDDEEVFVGYPKRKKLEKEGLEMLGLYAAQIEVGKIPDSPHEVEREFKIPFEGLYVVGKIDRIDVDGPELIVTDYKSGSKEPDPWFLRHNLQFTAYAWAATELYGTLPDRMFWHHLRNGKLLETERTYQDIDDLKQMIHNAIVMEREGIHHRIYHEQVCGWCAYKGEICDDRELQERVENGIS